ncbi:hypothetical protein CC1G_03697 [Coprinopsis cinerea okayama7|uniref:F-box domain-containing protein n=1 Tax=Coprinopsis cinerea (strain Okayama-7 / 130 / ATCC MYA-4618 / FGSC 9003) TaxID=240176 RepID=A8N204_COPC7|nr:hypothetical protein CC1G_03697 [Coprinopsis cinerea okayama7\|eukprot:XP_001828903.2 hypothetical protein CC1G_03697 [Coprinopsis cinerea okayama7\
MAETGKPQFIDDLVPLILESTEHWWPRDYARLALVSPSWLYYVQKRIYACPTLYTFQSCALLANALQRNPSLTHLITGIEFRPTHDECRGQVTGEHFEGIRFLLSLQGLKRVVIGGQLSRRAERFLNTLSCPEAVEELVVDGSVCQDSLVASLEVDESFFFRFCNLNTLKLVNLEVDLIPPPTTIPLTTPINHLILANVDILGGHLGQVISGSSLDLLSVHACLPHDYDEQIRCILDSCQVEALHYSVSQACAESNARSFLSVAATEGTGLRALYIDGHFVDQGTLSDLAECCPSLQELAVAGRSVRVTVEEWCSFIKSRALPGLHKLRLPSGTNTPPFKKWTGGDWQALKAACLANDIQLLE